jgi:hypothetical protein
MNKLITTLAIILATALFTFGENAAAALSNLAAHCGTF